MNRVGLNGGYFFKEETLSLLEENPLLYSISGNGPKWVLFLGGGSHDSHDSHAVTDRPELGRPDGCTISVCTVSNGGRLL